jgi:uncharacterized protein YciI
MQFVLICRDRDGALADRLAARAEHLAGVLELWHAGRIIDGGAILDAEGQMAGSVVLCDFPDRAALNTWLESEPYVVGGVWDQIEILDFKRVAWPHRGQPI